MKFHKRLILSCLFFILFMLLIAIIKPSFIISKDDSIKKFGFEYNETIYSLGVIVVVLAVILFYIFSMIDLISN
jgi:hypothetical protein